MAGDELPDLAFEFEGVDLATLTSITLRIRRDDGILVTSAGVVDDAANGLGHFEFVAGDLTAGTHEAEIVTVRASDSKPNTIPDAAPMQLIVREQV